MVSVEHWGLAQNFQRGTNSPSEIVFFSSYDSHLTLFQLVTRVVAVIAREENNT